MSNMPTFSLALFNFLHGFAAYDPHTETELGLDLNGCARLEWLGIMVDSGLKFDASLLATIRKIVDTWPQGLCTQTLQFETRPGTQLRRSEFTEVLDALGPITESWLINTIRHSEEIVASKAISKRRSLRIRMPHREESRGWWWWNVVQTLFLPWTSLSQFYVRRLCCKSLFCEHRSMVYNSYSAEKTDCFWTGEVPQGRLMAEFELEINQHNLLELDRVSRAVSITTFKCCGGLRNVWHRY